MIKTHGLSHVALSVLDPERSLAFYKSVFGVREYFRSDSTIQVLGPGKFDVLAFEKRMQGDWKAELQKVQARPSGYAKRVILAGR